MIGRFSDSPVKMWASADLERHFVTLSPAKTGYGGSRAERISLFQPRPQDRRNRPRDVAAQHAHWWSLAALVRCHRAYLVLIVRKLPAHQNSERRISLEKSAYTSVNNMEQGPCCCMIRTRGLL